MKDVDKRFALVAENGHRLYPYKKSQKSTNRYGFALTAPGEQDRHGGGTYTDDIRQVVKRLVFDGWSARVTTVDLQGRQRDGTLGIGKKSIKSYEIAEELEIFISGADVQPSRVIAQKSTAESQDGERGDQTGEADALEFEATGNVDEIVIRAIRSRRGQPEFRAALMMAYGGKCCISGCDVSSVLEAAHIVPHASGGTYEISNGLLLRADLHTLYDLGLIGVDESGQVQINSTLGQSDYRAFDGVTITDTLPPKMKENLKSRFTDFQLIREMD